MPKIVLSENIEDKIFMIRGQRVMISTHLADLYGVTTSALSQAVRRNIDRFPPDFMFLLERKEIMNLSQFVISSRIKHAPNIYVFTEQGVAMLSSVLKSKRAALVNIAIMRAFVRLRRIISTNLELGNKLNELEKRTENHDKEIQSIFVAIRQLMAPPLPPKKRIGFIGTD